MTALLLAPHNDDEVIFAGFSVIRHEPHVVTCFQSWTQKKRGGPTHNTRERETAAALHWLGATSWQQLPVRDDEPDLDMLEALIRQIDEEQNWDLVLAPAYEEGGHDQHNEVAILAETIFGPYRLVKYLTYVRGSGKTRSDTEVPFDAGMVARKLSALAQYESQIETENTRFWFMDETIREWYA